MLQLQLLLLLACSGVEAVGGNKSTPSLSEITRRLTRFGIDSRGLTDAPSLLSLLRSSLPDAAAGGHPVPLEAASVKESSMPDGMKVDAHPEHTHTHTLTSTTSQVHPHKHTLTNTPSQTHPHKHTLPPPPPPLPQGGRTQDLLGHPPRNAPSGETRCRSSLTLFTPTCPEKPSTVFFLLPRKALHCLFSIFSPFVSHG